ncbi:hypothetical protein BHF71_03695 [Vulcanibacillus modesticaldus]|uniref:serine-type D-Ala-D-Ala carboxypeptidase n=1 Tax=Vulcanibacillus modesticaldus TaxID=337097 RepID=A0A1D2YSH9_9BACI|nr:D-alanyl-D-alanine carboxypeptidase family protein [Vulcanibacillus modesticaldus]OEF97250.1 hypothetical protein BHF71_03695 [Vulcanibacillus modesticaldus]
MITFKFQKKILTLILLLLSFSIITDEVYSQSTFEPEVSAEGAVLIDVDSGRVLFEKNPDKKMRIASLTKIMTAIIAIENGNLNDLVTTSSNAHGVEGSSIYLKKGEKLTLEDMLYGLILRSGNDAAVAIAEHIGGSIEGFAYLMNEKAAYLGMTNTHFVNPHGLDNKDHYSTPRDMAILTAYALKNPVFRKIVSTKVKIAPSEGESWNRRWINKNKLLYRYKWADGVKTGYTKLARRCLASSATKDGVQLASITLNAPDDWNDHIKLFEYGFNIYEHKKIVNKGEKIGKIRVGKKYYELMAVEDFSYPIKAEEKELITKKVALIKNIQELNINEISSNQILGRIKFYLNNKYIGSIPIQLKKEKQN